MKKLKISICALILICSGLLFVGCKGNGPVEPSKLSFDANEVVVGNRIFTYDGASHICEISYPNVNVDVTYSLDKVSYVPAEQLNFVNAGRYILYYKLTAEGYNDYISKSVVVLINPKPITINLNDTELIKSNDFTSFSYEDNDEIIEGDFLSLKYSVVDDTDPENIITITSENAVAGQTYTLTATQNKLDVTTKNYDVTINNATVFMKDKVELQSSAGTNYYSTLSDAVSNAQSGDTIYLNDFVFTNETIEIDKTLTIDGRGKYYVVAETGFSSKLIGTNDVKSIFHVENVDATLTLKDIILDCNEVVRGVSALSGKVVLNNATITKGAGYDAFVSGGAYIGGSATLEMNGGAFSKNSANVNLTSTSYEKDLLIETSSQSSVINAGTLNNIAVNAGKLTFAGGSVSQVYVNYSPDVDADFAYQTGTVGALSVSMVNYIAGTDQIGKNDLYYSIKDIQAGEYIGGRIVYSTESTTEFYGQNFTSNIDSLLVDGNNYIFDNCTFTSAISSSKKVGLTFNNCTFTTGDTGVGGYKCIYLTSITSLMVNACTFTGNTSAGSASTAGYALDLNLYSTDCGDIIISNNNFQTISSDADVAISIKTRLGETDNPSDSWNDGVNTVGIVSGKIYISNNSFTADCNNIYLGTGPKGSDQTNISSGDFYCVLSENTSDLNLYLRYLTNESTVDPIVLNAGYTAAFGNKVSD